MPSDRQDLRRQLMALAATQSGYFTAAQALKLGYSYPAQKFHADRGNWLRVDRGIFRIPEWPVGQHEDLVRWSLWARSKAAVSHETALAVHDLGVANPAVIDLTVPPRFRARADGVRLHFADLPQDDIEQREGFRITTPLRTILDVAAGNTELDELVAAVVDACERSPATKTNLLMRAEEFGPHAALRVERALRHGELL
ncbi:MAG: hypothetical protein U0V73_05675 [Acidimicrobiia bacterium]